MRVPNPRRLLIALLACASKVALLTNAQAAPCSLADANNLPQPRR